MIIYKNDLINQLKGYKWLLKKSADVPLGGENEAHKEAAKIKSALGAQIDNDPRIKGRHKEYKDEIERELDQLVRSSKFKGDELIRRLREYYSLQSREIKSGKEAPTYTVREGDTLKEVVKQFVCKNRKPTIQELVDLNKVSIPQLVKNPNKIEPCWILNIPKDWRFKPTADFYAYRKGRKWSPPGANDACLNKPAQPEEIAKKPRPQDKNRGSEGKIQKKEKDNTPPAYVALTVPALKRAVRPLPLYTPLPKPQPAAMPNIPVSKPQPGVIPMPKTETGLSAAVFDLAKYLRKGDIITYVNSKGATMKAIFESYAKTTVGKAQVRILKPKGSANPLYALDPQTITAVERGGNPLDITQLRLSRHGLQPEALEAIAKMKLNPAEITSIEQELITDPKNASRINEVLAGSKYAKYDAFIKGFRKYGTLLYVCTVIYGFHNAKDKVGFLTQSAAELGGFLVGVKVAEMTAGRYIQHPLLRLGVDLLAGVAASMGAGKVYSMYVAPKLETYMPNRNQNTTGWNELGRGFESLGMTLGGAASGTVEFALEKAGITGGVDADTDPLDYLNKTVTMATVSAKDLDRGIWKKYIMRDMSKLSREAKKAYEKKGEELKKEKRQVHRWKLERERRELKKFFENDKDGKPLWVGEKLAHLEAQKRLIDFLVIQFSSYADKISPSKGVNFIANLLSRVDRGVKLVESGEESLWKELFKTKVDFDQKITFADFLTFYKLHSRESQQMKHVAFYRRIKGEMI